MSIVIANLLNPGDPMTLDDVTSETSFDDLRVLISKKLHLAPGCVVLSANAVEVESYPSKLGDRYRDDEYVAFKLTACSQNIPRRFECAECTGAVFACFKCGDQSLLETGNANTQFCVLNCGCLSCTKCMDAVCETRFLTDPGEAVTLCPMHLSPTVNEVTFLSDDEISPVGRLNQGRYLGLASQSSELESQRLRLQEIKNRCDGVGKLSDSHRQLQSLRSEFQRESDEVAANQPTLDSLLRLEGDAREEAEAQISDLQAKIAAATAQNASRASQIAALEADQPLIANGLGEEDRDPDTAEGLHSRLVAAVSTQADLVKHLEAELARDRSESRQLKTPLYRFSRRYNHPQVDALVARLKCQNVSRTQGSCTRLATNRCECLGPFMCRICLDGHLARTEEEANLHGLQPDPVTPARALAICTHAGHKNFDFNYYCVEHRQLLCQFGRSPSACPECRLEAIGDSSHRDRGIATAAKCRRNMIETVLSCEAAKIAALKGHDVLTANEYDNLRRLERNCEEVSRGITSQFDKSIAQLQDIIRQMQEDRDQVVAKVRARTDELKTQFVQTIREQQRRIEQYVAKTETIANKAKDTLSLVMQLASVAPQIVPAINNGFQDFVNANGQFVVPGPTIEEVQVYRASMHPFHPVVRMTASSDVNEPTSIVYESKAQDTVDAMSDILQNNVAESRLLADLSCAFNAQVQECQASSLYTHVLHDRWVGAFAPQEWAERRGALTDEEFLPQFATPDQLALRFGDVATFARHASACIQGSAKGGAEAPASMNEAYAFLQNMIAGALP